MKKFLAILLALTLTLGLAVTAFASDTPNTADKGTITVSNVTAETKLNVYQILSVNSYGTTNKYYANYSFVNAGYKGVFVSTINNTAITSESSVTDIMKYINDNGNAEFAKKLAANLKAYIAANNIAATMTETSATANAAKTELTFSNVNLGYYLLDDVSTYTGDEVKAVALMLDNAAPTADVKLKTSSYNPPVKSTTATSVNVGDEIPYTIAQTVPDISNFDSYTLSIVDTLGAGQTFNANSLVVKNGTTTLAKDTDYTVTVNGQVVTIDFGEIVGQFESNAALTVTYTATVNADAANTITNSVKTLENKVEVNGNGTTVYTYGFDATKVNEDGDKLAGVTFKVYKQNGDTKNYLTFGDADANNQYVYSGTSADGTLLTTNADGYLKVWGLAAGTYYLEEITPLAGYNNLAAPITVKIASGDGTKSVGNIVNYTGVELPSTGGMGTTIFTICGMLILMTSGLFLALNRKRLFNK